MLIQQPRKAVLDFETVSSVDLDSTSLRRYLARPEAGIYSLMWSFDGQEVFEWSNTHKDDPSALMDEDVHLWAHNAPFDFTVWNQFWGDKYGKITTNKGSCSMALASFHGLPAGLENLGVFLGLGGKAPSTKPLMRQLHKGEALSPEDHQKFMDYNRRDVLLTWQVCEKLDWGAHWTDLERNIWLMTCRMNNRGWKLNMPLIQRIRFFRERLNVWGVKGIKRITDGRITTPKSTKLMDWIYEECGRRYTSLDKYAVDRLIKDMSLPQKVRDMLFFKQSCGGSATVKADQLYERGLNGRIKDEFIYCGAANTNRFSSRGTQLHNILRLGVPSDAAALRLAKREFPNDVALTIPRSRLWNEKYRKALRSCLIADDDEWLYIADFTGIEMRIVMWYAEEWGVLENIIAGGDPYVDFAKQVFSNPNLTKKDKFERTQAKAAMLGCGYNMGWQRFKQYVNDFGLEYTDTQAADMVEAYRKTYWRVPQVWQRLDQAFRLVILEKFGRAMLIHQNKQAVITADWRDAPVPHIRVFGIHNSPLYYYNPMIRNLAWGSEIVATRARKKEDNLYGGKIFENVVQSTARHIFARAMLKIERAGYKIVGQVHDEIIVSAPAGHEENLMKLLSQSDPAMPGLPISLDLGVKKYYTKI